MRLPAAAVGSTVFFLVAPGTVALLVPWLLTDWGPGADLGVVLRGVGWLLVAIGVLGLVHSFVRFVRQGLGTPAPVAPTQQLVVTGIYRHVRNPMYLSVIAAVLGQALILGSGVLLGYAVLAAAVMWAFVRLYEEPTLGRQFGAEYAAYRAAVPGWWPRLRAWRPGQSDR